MGCISSKRAAAATASPPPVFDQSRRTESRRRRNTPAPPLAKALSPMVKREEKKEEQKEEEQEQEEREKKSSSNDVGGKNLKVSKSKRSNSNFSLTLQFGSTKSSQVVAQQTTAGWPGWLSAVAGEAIHGWLPLRADGFEKLEKVVSVTGSG